MRVCGYDKFDGAIPCSPNPAGFQIETAGVSVDFDGAARFGDGIQYRVHFARYMTCFFTNETERGK